MRCSEKYDSLCIINKLIVYMLFKYCFGCRHTPIQRLSVFASAAWWFKRPSCNRKATGSIQPIWLSTDMCPAEVCVSTSLKSASRSCTVSCGALRAPSGCRNARGRAASQFSVSEESDTSASLACLLRTFQCKHWARLSNQSYTRSWQQIEGTG